MDVGIDVGARFDGLEIVGRIGQGAMGTLFLAEERDLDRVVAVKVLLPELARDEATIRRFEREMKAVAGLNHANVVRLYRAGRMEGSLYLVLEYVDGEDLGSRLRRAGSMEPQVAIRVARDVAEGLAEAHARGIVHRDVKPANVLLGHDEAVKVTDFGLCKVAAETGWRTATGILVGTPTYMAPESFLDAEARPCWDVYSLGIMLLEMLVGAPPILADLSETVRAKQDDRLVGEIVRREAIGEGIRAFLMTAAAAAPSRRYPCGREACEALEALLTSFPASARTAALTVAEPSEDLRPALPPRGEVTIESALGQIPLEDVRRPSPGDAGPATRGEAAAPSGEGTRLAVLLASAIAALAALAVTLALWIRGTEPLPHASGVGADSSGRGWLAQDSVPDSASGGSARERRRALLGLVSDAIAVGGDAGGRLRLEAALEAARSHLEAHVVAHRRAQDPADDDEKALCALMARLDELFRRFPGTRPSWLAPDWNPFGAAVPSVPAEADMLDVVRTGRGNWWAEVLRAAPAASLASERWRHPLSHLPVYLDLSKGKVPRWLFLEADLSGGVPAGAVLAVEVNGWEAAAFPLSGELGTLRLRISGRLLVAGTNRLRLGLRAPGDGPAEGTLQVKEVRLLGSRDLCDAREGHFFETGPGEVAPQKPPQWERLEKLREAASVLGGGSVLRKELEALETACDEVLRERPGDRHTLWRKAWACEMLNRPWEAVFYYDLVLAPSPESVWPFHDLGRCLMSMQRDREAMPLLRWADAKAEEVRNLTARVWSCKYMAQISERQGDEEGLIRYRTLYWKLVEVRSKSGGLDEAIQHEVLRTIEHWPYGGRPEDAGGDGSKGP